MKLKNLALMRGFIVLSFSVLFAFFSYATEPETRMISENIYELEAKKIFTELGDNNSRLPSFEVFNIAYKGFNSLKNDSHDLKHDILTVSDFSLSSNEKRMWVIDLQNNKVLFNDLVAHGRNSGNEFARKFSNIPETNMSSIGFYVTGKTYHGKHGLSLFLHGKDRGFNDNAKRRAIVMHGADYVSESFIKKYGRLGRSFGCPSVSMTIYKDLINTIADGSCIFIYYPDDNFLKKSNVLLRSLKQS